MFMATFDTGISDYIHFQIQVDVAFPVTTKGEAVIVCEYCKLFTGRRCCLTEEVIIEPKKYVGYNCPLRKEESDV